MLVLTRMREESLMIGENIEVRILDVRGDRVRLGIVAPSEVAIYRAEIYQAIQKENMEASRTEGIDVDLQLLRPKARKDFSKQPKDLPPSSEL